MVVKQNMQREPDSEVRDHADHAGGDCRQSAGQCRMGPQPLNDWRTQEHEHEAWRERHPERQHRGDDAARRAGQWPGRPKAGEEADELQNQDQRTRCRFREAKTREHLRGRQPVIRLDRVLRDIGEHRVSTADGDNRHLGEEPGDVRERAADGNHQESDRQQPQRKHH